MFNFENYPVSVETKIVISLLIVILIVLITIIPFESRDQEGTSLKGGCLSKIEIYDVEFEGRVNDKMFDKENHHYPTIILVDHSNRSVILPNEKSGFYSFIKKGDHLSKEKNSLVVKILRKSDTIIHKLKYDCEN